jgi:predicted O-methyltransferase YrrM
MGVRSRLFRPGSPVAGPVYRTVMAASLPSVARQANRAADRADRAPAPARRASRALGSALRTTALGQPRAEERAWVDRIEARRDQLASGGAVEPRIAERGSAVASEALPPIPTWVASIISLHPVWCLFLMRLVRELAPRSCLELGTGFGISGAYQAASLELNGVGALSTLEGAPQLAEIAEQGFAALRLNERVEVGVGPLEDTLGHALERAAPVDYAFLDADHTAEATLEHFNAIVTHLSDGAVVVLDDINWAEGRAWRTIRRHDRVSVALGLLRVGIVVISERRYRRS